MYKCAWACCKQIASPLHAFCCSSILLAARSLTCNCASGLWETSCPAAPCCMSLYILAAEVHRVTSWRVNYPQHHQTMHVCSIGTKEPCPQNRARSGRAHSSSPVVLISKPKVVDDRCAGCTSRGWTSSWMSARCWAPAGRAGRHCGASPPLAWRSWLTTCATTPPWRKSRPSSKTTPGASTLYMAFGIKVSAL